MNCPRCEKPLHEETSRDEKTLIQHCNQENGGCGYMKIVRKKVYVEDAK